MKHTQGEWVVHNNNISDFYDIDCDGQRIASVNAIPEHEDGVPVDEKIANARLIAAAPDLLESLLMLDSAIEDGDPQKVVDTLLNYGRKAIQKATL